MADEAKIATASATEEKPPENTEPSPKPAETDTATGTPKTDGDASATVVKVFVSPTENPFGVDDFENILQMEASEGADSGWQLTKETDGFVVFKKTDTDSESKLIKCFVTLPGISLDRALDLVKGYGGERNKWDDDNLIETLDEKTDFSVLYWILKMPAIFTDRDFVLASAIRTDEDNKRHIILYKDCEHPDKPPTSTYIRGEVFVDGMIIRPDGSDSSKITFIRQLNIKGWVPKFVANRLGVIRIQKFREHILHYTSELNNPKPTENGLTENIAESAEIKPSSETNEAPEKLAEGAAEKE